MPLTKIDTIGIQDDAITADQIADGTVIAADILDNTITGGKLATDIAISTSGNITTTGNFTSLGIDDNATSTAITIGSDERVHINGTPPASGTRIDPADETSGLNIYKTTEDASISLFRNDTSTSNGEIIGSLRGLVNDNNSSGFYVRTSEIDFIASATHSATNRNTDIVFKTMSGTTLSQKMRIADDGDISFYEDTGTTPKLFWDASAEFLGIGTISPTYPLSISSSFKGIEINDGTSTLTIESNTAGQWGNKVSGNNNWEVFTNSARRLTIDGSGNVGIGTSSPSSILNIEGANPVIKIGDTFGAGGAVMTSQIALDNGFMSFSTDINGNVAQQNEGYIFNSHGSEIVRLTGNGNVGIGESSPDTRLHINETINVGYTVNDFTTDANALLKLENPSTTASAFSAIQFRTGNGADLFIGSVQGSGNEGDFVFARQDSTDIELMRIDSSGRVSIGGDDPSSYSSGAYNLVISQQSGSNAGITINNDGANIGSIFFANGTSETGKGRIRYYHSDDHLEISTVDTERMRIDSSGNVGIGTSSPSKPLHVSLATGSGATPTSYSVAVVDGNDNTEFSILGGSSSVLAINFGHSGDADDGRITYNTTSGSENMAFVVNASEAMRIDSSGNVGIGTTSPSGKLHVVGDETYFQRPSDTVYLRINTGNGSADLDAIGGVMRFRSDTTERMRIDSSGNLLVGTTSGTINTSNFGHKLEGGGTLRTSANSGSGATVAEHFGSAGQFRVMGDGDAENTNNSYGALSDRTLKENETPSNSQWNDIKALQIKNYNLIEYPDRPQIGVIAQDLEEAGMNGLVKTDDEGLKSVKYSVLYMKAVKALQEALIEIDNLKARVDTLEGN